MASKSGDASYRGGKKVGKAVSRSRAVSNLRPPNRSSNKRDIRDLGYVVDIGDLLFTPERDFLVKSNGEKVMVDDLKGKTIVLYIFPLEEVYIDLSPGTDYLDMIEAYNLLLQKGDKVEFVFVPLYYDGFSSASQEACYNRLHSAMPFPAIPFSDAAVYGILVAETFAALMAGFDMPYWVMIDPTNTVVATRCYHSDLFKLFGGEELYPLSIKRIRTLEEEAYQSKKELVRKWHKLLAHDTRDFLLSSNGDKVPISSLQGKVIGLYFCENIPHPPRMELIKGVYQDAKSRGYDFEIVQINFHYRCFNPTHLTADLTVQQCYENIGWLTLPFKDPSCRKLQRILECEIDARWRGDCLVIVDARQADIHFEQAGAEIFEIFGAEGYPFTRESLFDAEYRRHKEEVTVQHLFPLGESLLCRSAGDPVDGSPLFGKRVLVLFGGPSAVTEPLLNFLYMLKTKYLGQHVAGAGAEEDEFEVVYVLIESCQSGHTEDMPWLVCPYSADFVGDWVSKVFGAPVRGVFGGAAAFGKDGELIAKEVGLAESWGELEGHKHHHFPFIFQDLEARIRWEVEARCQLDAYYDYNES